MATPSQPERESVDVILDASELSPTIQVGTLRFSRARTDLSASFEYEEDWLKDDRGFELDPRLELFAGEPSKALTFGIFQDAATNRPSWNAG